MVRKQFSLSKTVSSISSTRSKRHLSRSLSLTHFYIVECCVTTIVYINRRRRPSSSTIVACIHRRGHSSSTTILSVHRWRHCSTTTVVPSDRIRQFSSFVVGFVHELLVCKRVLLSRSAILSAFRQDFAIFLPLRNQGVR